MMVSLILASLAVLGGLFIAVAMLYVPNLFVSRVRSSDLPKHSTADSTSDSLYSDRSVPMKARIMCNMTGKNRQTAFSVSGFSDCRMLETVYNGNLVCKHGCLGLGSCARICPNDAISIRKGTISISSVCTGCGLCIPICPKNLIALVPAEAHNRFSCIASGKNISPEACPTVKNNYIISDESVTGSPFGILRSLGTPINHQRKK
ncbi:MAG: hypothetical protein EWM51_04705 [Treponema sp.]|nr:MAG: hypothetical protein EWM51_04705 [Treponema sp.]